MPRNLTLKRQASPVSSMACWSCVETSSWGPGLKLTRMHSAASPCMGKLLKSWEKSALLVAGSPSKEALTIPSLGTLLRHLSRYIWATPAGSPLLAKLCC